MRQYLLMTVLLVGTGCQGLRDCRRGGTDCQNDSCKHEKKPCAPPAKVQAPPPKEEITEQARAAALAQEVLLVPRTVYMPFVAQVPTAPVRLTSSMTVMPPSAPSVAPPPEKITSQPVTAPCPKEDCTQQQMLDLCKKLNQRLDHMERCLQDRKVTPRTVCPPADCPPSQPLFPQLFRRPLFNRCEPSLPECKPVQHMEPIAAPVRTTNSNTNALSPIPQPVQQIEPIAAPTRTTNTNPEPNTDPESNTNTTPPIPQPPPANTPLPVLPIE